MQGHRPTVCSPLQAAARRVRGAARAPRRHHAGGHDLDGRQGGRRGALRVPGKVVAGRGRVTLSDDPVYPMMP